MFSCTIQDFPGGNEEDVDKYELGYMIQGRKLNLEFRKYKQECWPLCAEVLNEHSCDVVELYLDVRGSNLGRRTDYLGWSFCGLFDTLQTGSRMLS